MTSKMHDNSQYNGEQNQLIVCLITTKQWQQALEQIGRMHSSNVHIFCIGSARDNIVSGASIPIPSADPQALGDVLSESYFCIEQYNSDGSDISQNIWQYASMQQLQTALEDADTLLSF